jgi:hypothetical protein
MTTTPDFRALCAELAFELEDWMSFFDLRPSLSVELLTRARAALATPPPKPPADEELYDYWISTSPQFGCADPVGFARAVLERWGHG